LAFDHGLFTITDGRTVKVSPAVRNADRKRFDLEEYEGNNMISPQAKPAYLTSKPCIGINRGFLEYLRIVLEYFAVRNNRNLIRAFSGIKC